jgi:hypothetical protein
MQDDLTPEEIAELQALEAMEAKAMAPELSSEEEQELMALEAKDAEYNNRIEEQTTFGSVARGVAQSVTFGFADEISGAVESSLTEKSYEQARDESRTNFQIAQEANPAAFLSGEVAGGIASAVAAGPGALAAKAVGMGAIQALGNSEEDKIENQLQDALFGGAVAGVIDRATFGAGKLFGKAKNQLGDVFQTQASRLSLKGLGIKNKSSLNKLNKKLDAKGIDTEEFLNRFENIEMADGKKLLQGFKSQETLLEDVVNTKSMAGKDMGAVLKSIDIEKGGSAEIDPLEFAEHLTLEVLEPLRTQGTFDSNAIADQLEKRIGFLANRKSKMSMTDLHNWKVNTQEKVNFLKKQNTDLELNSQLKNIVRQSNEFIHSKVESLSSNPKALTEFQELKKTFGTLADAEEFIEQAVMDNKEGMLGNVRNVLSNIPFNGGLTVVGGFAGGVPGAMIGTAITVAGKNPKISRQLGKSMQRVGSFLKDNPTNERYYQMLANASVRSNEALKESIQLIERNLDGFIIDEEEKASYELQIKSSNYSTRSKMQLLQQVNQGLIPNMESAEQEQPFLREYSPRSRDNNGKKTSN